MNCIVIGVHETDCFTYVVDKGSCALLKIKGELSFKLKSAENIDDYIRGLSNGLHKDVFDGFDALLIYFNSQRMSVTFQIADRLSREGCRYVSAAAAGKALVPVSSKLLKQDNRYEVWEILGGIYQVRSFGGELYISSAVNQRGKETRSVSAAELCFSPSDTGGKDTFSAEKIGKLKQNLRTQGDDLSTEARSLLNEIYALMGMTEEVKSQRQLLKRLSYAYALYKIPEPKRFDITEQELIGLANDKALNPYCRLMFRLNKEIDGKLDLYCLFNDIKRISDEEHKIIKKEIRDYVTLSELGETDFLQKIKDDIISKKLGEIWKEREKGAK